MSRVWFSIADTVHRMSNGNSGDRRPIPDCFMCRKPAGQYHTTIATSEMARCHQKPRAICPACTETLEQRREQFAVMFSAGDWGRVELWPTPPRIQEQFQQEEG